MSQRAPGAEERDPTAEPRPPVWVWLFPMALLVLAIVSVPIMVLEPRGLPRFRALESELRDIERDNEGLAHEVRDGEIVFQFPE